MTKEPQRNAHAEALGFVPHPILYARFLHEVPPYIGGKNIPVNWAGGMGQSLDGAPINTTGYEVIITKDVPDDPNGFSRPAFDVHVPPSETALSVPSKFLEPGTRYGLEVLALEVSGNQTITALSFETQ